MRNPLKAFALFLAIILLTNCDKEEIVIENHNSLNSPIQKYFNKNIFSKTIPFDFKVDWNNNVKHYSEELEVNYYEFPLIYNLNTVRNDANYQIDYKILVTEIDNNDFEFYVVKFLQKTNIDNSLIIKENISFSNSQNYTGIVHLIDTENDMVFAKKLENGKLLDNKLFFDKEFKKDSFAKRMAEDCSYITTQYYKEWYTVWTDSDGFHQELRGVQYLGSEINQVCDEYWLPELNIYGSNSQGTYKGPDDPSDTGLFKQPCDDTVHGCNYEIEVTLEEIKIDDNITDPCAKEIFGALLEEKKQNDIKPEVMVPNSEMLTFSGSILNMFNTFNEFDYIINNGAMNSGYGALTNRDGNTITTTLSNNYLENATDLAIAMTIIHEATHAYMIYKIDTDGDYASTLAEFYSQYGGAEGRSQHEFMIEYLNAMAYSLYTWDKNNVVNGGNLGWEYYYSMSFKGMFYRDSNGNTTETDAFKELIPDPIERNKIIQILINETKGNDDAKGKKCD